MTVFDSGANLSFAALATTAANAEVDSIVVSSATVQLTVAQWSADGVALAELYNPDSSSATIEVADSAGAIDGVLSSLNAAAQVARIVVSSGQVQVDAATAASAPALAKLFTSARLRRLRVGLGFRHQPLQRLGGP